MEKKLKILTIRITDFMYDQIESYKKYFFDTYKIKVNTTETIEIAINRLLQNIKNHDNIES